MGNICGIASFLVLVFSSRDLNQGHLHIKQLSICYPQCHFLNVTKLCKSLKLKNIVGFQKNHKRDTNQSPSNKKSKSLAIHQFNASWSMGWERRQGKA